MTSKMDLSFMETVWWVFALLFEKGLVYKGFKFYISVNWLMKLVCYYYDFLFLVNWVMKMLSVHMLLDIPIWDMFMVTPLLSVLLSC